MGGVTHEINLPAGALDKKTMMIGADVIRLYRPYESQADAQGLASTSTRWYDPAIHRRHGRVYQRRQHPFHALHAFARRPSVGQHMTNARSQLSSQGDHQRFSLNGAHSSAQISDKHQKPSREDHHVQRWCFRRTIRPMCSDRSQGNQGSLCQICKLQAEAYICYLC